MPSNFKFLLYRADLIDRFYNIRQEKRSKLIIYSILVCIILFLVIIYSYFYGLFYLQSSLGKGADSLIKLQSAKTSFTVVQTEFIKIADQISHNNNPQTIISVVEGQARSLGLQISNMPKEPNLIDLPTTSVLGSDFKKARIEFKISGVSLKKMTDFFNGLNSLPNKFKILKLDILQTFGNKLYFDVGVILEAYVPVQKDNG